MTLPRSVANVLRSHVTLEVEGIDRMDLSVYQRLSTSTSLASMWTSVPSSTTLLGHRAVADGSVVPVARVVGTNSQTT
jgi:hypothetical protein